MLVSNRFLNYVFCEEKTGEEKIKWKENTEPEAKFIPEMLWELKCVNFPSYFLGLHAFNVAWPAELSVGFPVESVSGQTLCLP